VGSSSKWSVPWFRIVTEGVVIVFSILLAFGIDAWWDGRRDRGFERDALEVLALDLSAAIEHLSGFREGANETATASVNAYAALSVTPMELERDSVWALLMRAYARTTVRLPRAGYTDLLTTGTLGLVRDREVRDAIIQFYESAERYETIIEKNSTTYTDGFLGAALIMEGLVYPMPEDAQGTVSTLSEADRLVFEKLGPGFEHRPDPMWDLAPDSREWNRLRSALLQNGRGIQTSVLLADVLLSEADALRKGILSHREE
jgi:hypothetical protein